MIITIQCNMPKLFLLALLLLLNPIHDILADDDIGYTYYQKGDYKKALEVWSQEVERGNREAMYNIGLLYFFGKGVERDLPLAFEYCKKAAYKGSSRAQNNLAYMYTKGLGTKKNYVLAFAWSEIAIDNGYDSQNLRDNASIHLTPAMYNDAKKFFAKLKREIKDD